MDRETQELKDSLDSQRSHVLGILEGLSDEQLRRPVLPSGWTCLGMVKHLALADERYWFRCIMGGESTDYFPAGADAEWQLAPGESAEDVFRLYRDEIERSNEIIAATGIDDRPRQLDPRWGEWGQRFTSLRVVMLHMIVETANHAGHLDAARELLDGRQWVVIRD